MIDCIATQDIRFLHLAHNTALRAARAAGQAALAARSQVLQAHSKGPRDLVTNGDYAAQESAINTILASFPDHSILSEEGEGRRSDSPHCWILDPIDGTTNYYRGLPFYSVSIALEVDGETLVGAVYDPVRQEMFSAMRGQGAYCDGERIRVREITDLRECVFSLGLAYDTPSMERMLTATTQVVPLCSTLRELGSAALALSYIACGRLDAYMHPSLKPWDAAAGALILREAGGKMTNSQGHPWRADDGFSLAASPPIHDQLLELVRSVLPDL